jgi:O-antigen/teichoic acid export membrane protein
MSYQFKHVLKNALYLISSRFIVGIFTILTFSLLAKTFGTQEFGLLAFGVAVGEMFAIICDFGLSYLIVREIARGGDSRMIVGQILYIKSYFNVALIIVATITVYLMYDFHTFSVLSWNLLYGMFFSYFMFFTGVFNGFEKMSYSSISNGILSLVISVCSLLLVYFDQNSALLISFLRFLIVLIVSMIVFLKSGSLIRYSFVSINKERIKELINTIYPFGLFFIGGVLYMQIDVFIIKHYLAESYIGIYQSVFKIIVFLEVIPQMVANSLYPSITHRISTTGLRVENIIVRSTKALFIFGCLLAILFNMYSKEIVLFLYSQEYQNSIYLLKIFSFLIPLRFAGHVFGVTITVFDNQKGRMFTSLSATVISVALNVVFIPIYGLQAAAFSSLLVSLYTVSMYSILVKKIIPIHPVKEIFGLSTLGIIVSIIGASYLQDVMFKAIACAISVLLFMGFLILTRVLDENDFKIFSRFTVKQ